MQVGYLGARAGYWSGSRGGGPPGVGRLLSWSATEASQARAEYGAGGSTSMPNSA